MADASVIPKITSGVTSSVAMAIAENTADLIRGRNDIEQRVIPKSILVALQTTPEDD